MKTKVLLSRNPNPLFPGIASIIAKGEPPTWLIHALEHFSDELGTVGTLEERKKLENVLGEMNDAIEVLLKWLPIFEHLPFGVECPDDAAVALDALPGIKKDLDRLINKVRSRSVVGHEICAAVIVEAWKLLHGEAEPRSLQLQLACKEYWLACGGEPRGETDDLENWRRPVERALVTNHSWVRSILLAVQNEH
jgi:hypothetical protein